MANTLVATQPIADSTIKTAPSAVTITTELPLMDMGNEVSVTDPTGARVDDGTLTIAGTDVLVGLKPITQSGIYKVTYSLLAENDVPLTGSFTFNFSAPVMETPRVVEPTTEPEVNGSNFGTNVFVIGMLVVSAGVLIAMALYARKLFKGR